MYKPWNVDCWNENEFIIFTLFLPPSSPLRPTGNSRTLFENLRSGQLTTFCCSVNNINYLLITTYIFYNFVIGLPKQTGWSPYKSKCNHALKRHPRMFCVLWSMNSWDTWGVTLLPVGRNWTSAPTRAGTHRLLAPNICLLYQTSDPPPYKSFIIRGRVIFEAEEADRHHHL